MIKLEELVNTYNELQRRIYDVIEENRYNQNDEVVNTLDLLEQSEERFGVEFLDFLMNLNEKEELSEV